MNENTEGAGGVQQAVFGLDRLFPAVLDRVSRLDAKYSGENREALDKDLSQLHADTELLLAFTKRQPGADMQIQRVHPNSVDELSVTGNHYRFFFKRLADNAEWYEFTYLKAI